MASRSLDDLDPRFKDLAAKVLGAMQSNSHGFEVHLTATLRDFPEQDKLFAMGRTMPGAVVTNAKGGQSWHNYGLAFDVAPFVGGKAVWQYKQGGIWDELGGIGKSFGLIWGGDWRKPDRPHFEWHPGFTTSGVKGVRLALVLWGKGERPIPLEV